MMTPFSECSVKVVCEGRIFMIAIAVQDIGAAADIGGDHCLLQDKQSYPSPNHGVATGNNCLQGCKGRKEATCQVELQ